MKNLLEKTSPFRKNVVFLQPQTQMVGVAQLVRVPDCGSEGRGFESHLPPRKEEVLLSLFFLFICVCISKKCVVLCSKLHVAWSDSDASAAGVDDAVILATTGLNEEELKLL